MSRCSPAWAESRKQNLEGQIDFFGGFSAAGPAQTSEIPLPNIPEFSAAERMRQEKETTGLYLSGHPMDGFMPQAKRGGGCADPGDSGVLPR